MITEIVGGYLSNSIAIMSDALHLFSDLLSYFVSIFAITLASRGPSLHHNFGYKRAEILGALVSMVIIWVLTLVLVYGSIERFLQNKVKIDAEIMVITSVISIICNLIMGFTLHSALPHSHSHDHEHNHEHNHNLTNENEEMSVEDINLSHNDDDHHGHHHHNHENINVRAAFLHVVGDLV